METMLKPKRTAKDRILEALSDGSWKALHEFCLVGVSESAIGARLRETTQSGETVCRIREGKKFKEWKLEEQEVEGQLW